MTDEGVRRLQSMYDDQLGWMMTGQSHYNLARFRM